MLRLSDFTQCRSFYFQTLDLHVKTVLEQIRLLIILCSSLKTFYKYGHI